MIQIQTPTLVASIWNLVCIRWYTKCHTNQNPNSSVFVH